MQDASNEERKYLEKERKKKTFPFIILGKMRLKEKKNDTFSF